MIWIGFITLGVIIGYSINYNKYKKLVLEVVDNLYFTKKIDKEEYEYYKEKFISQKDSLKSVVGFLKRSKEGLSKK